MGRRDAMRSEVIGTKGAELLLSQIEYDHSMRHHDCRIYWLRRGDEWTKIDYSQKAETWMKPRSWAAHWNC
jgi:hypothetical protein